MMTTLAAPVMTMSIFKPIVFALIVGGWAWGVSTLDKDLEYFYLKRFMWNGIQMAAGIAAFGLWLIVPVFWLGLPAALLILVGTFVGYVAYRNHNVPPDQQWSLSMETFTRRIDAMQAAQAQKRATVTLLTADEAPIEVPSGDNPQAKGHRALEQVLDYALRRGADRIKLVTDASKAKMSVRIDGVHYPQDEIEAGVAIALMDYLKGHGGLDLAERRKKQSGMLKIDAGDLERHQLELLSSGSTRGLNLTMVIDPHQRVSVAFEQLGLLESQRQQFEPLIGQPGHMVLVSCPPEQGQTTTLYSLVQKHDPYIQGVNTLEDTVAFELEGVSHRMIPPNTDAEVVNNQLGAIIRSDPQVVLLTRFANARTARLAAKAAAEGIRFYVGMRNHDTFSTLRAWYKIIANPQAAAAALGAIMAQRLVRKLCTTCRSPYRPDPAALKKLNLPPNKVEYLYKRSGQVIVGRKPRTCPDCHGLGYRGRIAVFEVMTLDDTARELVAAGQTENLRSHLRKRKMLWMQEAALAKVVEGVSDIKEITRALAVREPSKKARTSSGSGIPAIKD